MPRAGVGAPYPVFLAIGGALLALLPASSFTLPPELVLALFVAPVLLDAAYDASLRDLRDNWAPVTGLVVCAVGITTAAVAVVVRLLVPEVPWARRLHSAPWLRLRTPSPQRPCSVSCGPRIGF